MAFNLESHLNAEVASHRVRAVIARLPEFATMSPNCDALLAVLGTGTPCNIGTVDHSGSATI